MQFHLLVVLFYMFFLELVAAFNIGRTFEEKTCARLASQVPCFRVGDSFCGDRQHTYSIEGHRYYCAEVGDYKFAWDCGADPTCKHVAKPRLALKKTDATTSSSS